MNDDKQEKYLEHSYKDLVAWILISVMSALVVCCVYAFDTDGQVQQLSQDSPQAVAVIDDNTIPYAYKQIICS